MANNCLVTKLKSVVENDNLKVLGQYKFYMKPATGKPNPTIYLSSSSAFTARTTGTLKLSNQSSIVIYPSQETYQLSVSGEGYLIFENKYNVKQINTYNLDEDINIDEITFMNNLKRLVSSKAYGNIANVLNNNPNINYIQLESKSIQGDLNTVDSAILNNIVFIKFGSSNITGTTSLFKNGKLTSIDVNNAKNFTGDVTELPFVENIQIYNSGVSGTIEGFVAHAIELGKNTGTDISLVGALAQLNFNSAKRTNIHGHYIAPCFVTWENANKIAVKTGEYGVANTTDVFVKGYSEQEITAKMASGEDWNGKYVTDVITGTVYSPS